MTSSPIPQVDGQLEEIELEQVDKEMLDEQLEEDSPQNPKSPNSY